MFNKDVLSIDIGGFRTKLVVGNYKDEKVNIKNMISIDTPLNSINHGEIIDIYKIRDLINKEISNNKQIKIKKVIFTLESTRSITRELILPHTKQEELKKILSFEAQQYFPVDLDEYVIQSIKLDDFEEDGVKKSKILATALPKIIVKSYLELANELNLTPMALDLHSNGISKFFQCNAKTHNRSNNDTLVTIDLGHENINIAIFNNNTLKFNRLLTAGGKDIDLAIANKFNISLEESNIKKMENSLNENEEKICFDIENIFQNCINNWIDEIQKVIKFYSSRSPDNQIGKIYLFGGHSNLKNIIRYFELSFQIPIEKIENINCINYKDSSLENISMIPYLNAIGAIIRK